MSTTAFLQTLSQFLRARLAGRSERGASLVEYALLIALIAAVCLVAVSALGTAVENALLGVSF
jgi:pilus assembly protein Flp/PilA